MATPLQTVYKAFLSKILEDEWQGWSQEELEADLETIKKEIEQRGCIGSIAEIYDSKRPQEPKGAIAQAWSVAEILRIVM